MNNDESSSPDGSKPSSETASDGLLPVANLDGEKLYTVLLHNARERKRTSQFDESEKLYEKLITHAQEWELSAHLATSMKELGDVYFRNQKFEKSLKTYKRVFSMQEVELGTSHPAIAHTEMMLGKCYQELRIFDLATKSLRSASIRFIQSEDIDKERYVECLCALSALYRDRGNFEASRTCIKQAYRVIPDADHPDLLNCAVLEELASALLGERRYEAAAAAYERVVAMKSLLLETQYVDIVTTLIDLGLCYFSCHKLNEAEAILIRAGELYHQLGYKNRTILIRLLETLAGSLRHQGQFVQAGVIEECASEMRGRRSVVEGHVLYGTLLEEAKAADLRGDLDTAQTKYRDALCALELQQEIRAADRLAILARLFLSTPRKHKVQRTSILTEIEDSLRQVFGNSQVDTEGGLKRAALIYRLCGKRDIAEALSSIGDELSQEHRLITAIDELIPRVSKDNDKLIN